MSADDSSRISPTAHYTAYVWYRHGLSTEELATAKGRAFYYGLQAANRVLALAGQGDMESLLLARHRVIDHLLARQIEAGRVGQIVELAAGLSPRGLRMRRRYPELPFVEGDLSDMAATKRRLIGDKLDSKHRVVTLNALLDEGPGSLADLVDSLDTSKGVVVITEGLLPYFDGETGSAIWRRVREFMRHFPHGLYLSDYYLGGDTARVLGGSVMKKMISYLVKGSTYLPLWDDEALVAALADAGFTDASVHMAGDFAQALQIESPRRSAYVRVIEARS